MGNILDILIPKWRNSIANALELRIFCIKPSICDSVIHVSFNSARVDLRCMPKYDNEYDKYNLPCDELNSICLNFENCVSDKIYPRLSAFYTEIFLSCLSVLYFVFFGRRCSTVWASIYQADRQISWNLEAARLGVNMIVSP